MIPWNEIESVFLDMDGTLLDLHFDNHFWREHVPLRYAERHQLDIDAAKSELVPRFRLKEGTLDWYCVEYWSRVINFLDDVRRNNKFMALVTNAHMKSLELKMEVTGLTDAFDALICSHDIGFPKEDQRFWAALGAREAFRNESTLFVDDSLSVLRAAREFGIRHILAVRKPDSRSPARDTGEFRAIDGFHEIMPCTTGIRSR